MVLAWVRLRSPAEVRLVLLHFCDNLEYIQHSILIMAHVPPHVAVKTFKAIQFYRTALLICVISVFDNVMLFESHLRP